MPNRDIQIGDYVRVNPKEWPGTHGKRFKVVEEITAKGGGKVLRCYDGDMQNRWFPKKFCTPVRKGILRRD